MERRNPLLTAPHYPDLGSASDCESKFPARHDQSEAPPRSGRNALTALVSQTSFRGEASGGAAKCRLFPFATVIFGSLLTLIVTPGHSRVQKVLGCAWVRVREWLSQVRIYQQKCRRL